MNTFDYQFKLTSFIFLLRILKVNVSNLKKLLNLD